MNPLAWPLQWLRGLQAGTTPRVAPHGPVWVQPLGGGHYRAGCRQCGCGDVFADATATRRFLRGHHAGAELVRQIAEGGDLL